MSDLDDLLDPGVRSRPSQTGGGRGSVPNGSAVLTLGILSIVGCFFYGVPGLICGIIALALHSKDKKVHASDPQFYEESFKNSKGGFICAIIGTSLSALFLLLIALGLASASSRFYM